MDEISLDRSSLISQGRHLLRLMAMDPSASEGPSGYNYWRITFQVADSKDPDAGQELTHILSQSPAARWRMDAFLDAMKAPPTGKATARSFVGKLCYGYVQHETDNSGTLRARIDRMEPFSGSPDIELLPEQAPADGSPVRSPSPRKAVEVEQEDLPF